MSGNDVCILTGGKISILHRDDTTIYPAKLRFMRKLGIFHLTFSIANTSCALYIIASEIRGMSCSIY